MFYIWDTVELKESIRITNPSAWQRYAGHNRPFKGKMPTHIKRGQLGKITGLAADGLIVKFSIRTAIQEFATVSLVLKESCVQLVDAKVYNFEEEKLKRKGKK
jgi:hypothetical protein